VSTKTKIEWTRSDDGAAGATWNPVTGCTEVSEGCDHCYAKTFTERWRGVPGHTFEQGFDVRLWPERLDLPLRWRKPKRVFVNSLADLFHEAVDTDFVARVFATMGAASHHTFQVLTKRPGRMASLLSSREFLDTVLQHRANCRTRPTGEAAREPELSDVWPLPDVWLGVSVETQKWAAVRLPLLARTAAAVRFVSCEPLLGSLDLRAWLGTDLDWVIAGGESGPRARCDASGLAACPA
jgi:protein gp37